MILWKKAFVEYIVGKGEIAGKQLRVFLLLLFYFFFAVKDEYLALAIFDLFLTLFFV